MIKDIPLSQKLRIALYTDDWSVFPRGVKQIAEETEELEKRIKGYKTKLAEARNIIFGYMRRHDGIRFEHRLEDITKANGVIRELDEVLKV